MRPDRTRPIAVAGGFALLAAVIVFVVHEVGPALRHPIAALRLILADAPAHLPVPVAGVRAADVSDSWGSPRPGGRHHQGASVTTPPHLHYGIYRWRGGAINPFPLLTGGRRSPGA